MFRAQQNAFDDAVGKSHSVQDLDGLAGEDAESRGLNSWQWRVIR